MHRKEQSVRFNDVNNLTVESKSTKFYEIISIISMGLLAYINLFSIENVQENRQNI